MATSIAEVKEIITALRNAQRSHQARIEHHKTKLELLDKDISMFQGKIYKGIGRRDDL